MENKYEKLFTEDMTEQEIGLLYYQMIDSVQKGSEEARLLDEAFHKASNMAFRKELQRRREYEEAEAKAGRPCVWT